MAQDRSSLHAVAQDIPLVWPKANEAHIIFGSSFALMRPGREAGVTNDPPLLVGFPARADPSHPSGSSVEVRTPKGRPKSGAVGTSQTATLETEFWGRRLSTPEAANGPQRPRNGHGRPTTGAASPGNIGLFCGLGNHVGLRGLLGGAEGIRTADLRGSTPVRGDGAGLMLPRGRAPDPA